MQKTSDCRKGLLSFHYFIYSLACCFIGITDLLAQADAGKIPLLKIVSREVSSNRPGFYGSIYLGREGVRLRSNDFISEDNGKTWDNNPMKPDLTSGLPYGYRWDPVTSVLDTNNEKIVTIVNALDVKDLDPTINEPPIAQETYYLRYRVSEDQGKTWSYDEPIVQCGNFTIQHPLPDIFIGKNSIYIGDIGSIPIVTQKRKILVPAQATLVNHDSSGLWNPGGGESYTDAVILEGTWRDDGKIDWKMLGRIEADPKRSTRGMIEPTLLEIRDGLLLVVMRGSNEKRGSNNYQLPSYKWFSISENGGKTWSIPEAFTFQDGKAFYSPSSMSTLFKHSSGRCFWVGNMTEENSDGNLPRWPLVIAELDTNNLKLIKSSLLVVDTRQMEDQSRGRLDISHISLIEDRKTGEIILIYPRYYNAYKSREWVTTRIAIK
ncbi:MAG: glycoside hydrolase [Chitinophagaceae bacterium]|nr:glycoside hydrolase [Chitinophagaceae bacterium]